MIRRSITITLMMTFACGLYAQEQKSILQLAEEAYAREEYALAGALYQRQARSKGDRTPAALLLKMARSYQEIGRFDQAAGVYRQLVAKPGAPAAAFFAYGEALRQLEQYDAARQQYGRFTTTNADSLQLKTIALQSCDSAVAWLGQPAPVQLQPVKELNTPGSDLVSGVTGQGLLLLSNGYRTLLLDGGAERNPQTDLRTQHPYYKAYVYRQYTQGNATMYLEELAPGLLGGFDYHIGPVCMSQHEDTLYATINLQGKNVPFTGKGPSNGVRQLQLYQSVKKDGRWSEMVLLAGINVAGHSSSHAVLSTDGSVLYFVSDRPGGLGQTDLWYCEKQADGNWGTPVNCGSGINTIASETFPTVNEAGILYFSSKGYPGLGGYDIYRAKGQKASWEAPENMKSPFNTGADDIGLVLKQNGYEGYLASNKKGGMGMDDIYYFADVDYSRRVNHGNIPGILQRPPGQKDPYAPTTPATNTGGGEVPGITKRPLTTEEQADKRQLEQLKFLYDYNSARLLPQSRQLLDQVAGILQRRPDWKIVIASFADNRGADQYNTDLSALRCFAVIDYLSGKGIDPGRLYYSNMGELQPVNKCKDGVPCSEEEYRENRRSEIKVKW